MAAEADSNQRVSVVIPTTGRDALVQAVASVLAQSVDVHQIIVSVDGPEHQVPTLPADNRIEVIVSSKRQGPNGARAAGIALATGTLIAFLDDDDLWEPQKIELQLAAYRRARRGGAQHVVVACRERLVYDEVVGTTPVPHQVMQPGQSVASYLFERSTFSGYTSILCPSMLLFDKALVERIPLDESITRHEDWDWLLRVDATGDVVFVMVVEPLIRFSAHGFGSSASSAGDWRTSRDWVRNHTSTLTDRERAEALLSTTVPLALQGGHWRSAAGLMGEAFPLRPSVYSWLFSLGHVPLVLGRRLRNTSFKSG